MRSWGVGAMLLANLVFVIAGSTARAGPATYDGSPLPEGLRQLRGEELRQRVIGAEVYGVGTKETSPEPETFGVDGKYTAVVILYQVVLPYLVYEDKICVQFAQGLGCYQFYVDARNRQYYTRPFDAGEQIIRIAIERGR